ncbi:MAG: T9SS type A sorting domain-containing protein [Janthinobacterium lividum]
MRFYTLLLGWLVGLLAGLAAGPAAAQLAPPAPAPLPCLLLPLGPAERVAAAPLIVEAQVLDARGEWDAGHQRIFTRQHLRVFQVLKGALPDTAALALLVEGGQVELARQELTNTLRPLPPGRQGIFFLVPAPWPGLAPAWAAYASSQGVITFDLAQNTATEPARPYASPAAALAQTSQLSGQPAQVLRPNLALAAAAQQAAARAGVATTQRAQALIVSSFSPAIAAAGTGAVLTIVGSGFGSSRGSGGVDFRNADDGGATTTRALAFDYLSWSDTRIQVRVPSLAADGHPAGTGPLRVTAADGSTADTATPLTIVYALTNVDNAGATFVDRPNHVATNGEGGLTFQLAPNFQSNAAAAAAWQRALAQWRCRTGINWRLGAAAAANTIALDQANVVAFDEGASLPARVLGRTTSYYAGCYDLQGEVVFRVQEVDQQFAINLPFQFGPALATAGQYDFESVTTHELGHAQQLAHLIRPGAIMHYGIGAGVNLRTLNPASDVAGGRLVLRTRSFWQRGCGGPALLPAPLTSLGPTTTGGAIFPFSTRDECFVSGFVLERSAGPDTTAAAAGWQVVASASAGQASGQYQLADLQPAPGLRYYRLGVRRPDGTIDYAAPLPAGAEAIVGPQLFPNPLASGPLQLSYPAAAAGTLELRLYDTVGRYCLGKAVSVQAGLNVLSLNTLGLTPGLYLLRLTASGQPSYTLRLMRL